MNFIKKLYILCFLSMSFALNAGGEEQNQLGQEIVGIMQAMFRPIEDIARMDHEANLARINNEARLIEIEANRANPEQIQVLIQENNNLRQTNLDQARLIEQLREELRVESTKSIWSRISKENKIKFAIASSSTVILGALVIAYKTNKTFHDQANSTANKVKSQFSSLWQWLNNSKIDKHDSENN